MITLEKTFLFHYFKEYHKHFGNSSILAIYSFNCVFNANFLPLHMKRTQNSRNRYIKGKNRFKEMECSLYNAINFLKKPSF